jgi:predicted Rossmann fold nucleotide-binding protein DprA/Smf involved in DNA uptake
MRAYIASNMPPKPLGPFEWFAVSILDKDYLGWLRPIPDPPLVLFCVGERDAVDRRPLRFLAVIYNRPASVYWSFN